MNMKYIKTIASHSAMIIFLISGWIIAIDKTPSFKWEKYLFSVIILIYTLMYGLIINKKGRNETIYLLLSGLFMIEFIYLNVAFNMSTGIMITAENFVLITTSIISVLFVFSCIIELKQRRN